MEKIQKIILLVVNVIIVCEGSLEDCKPKVAIIGGGIGGASAAHFISELFENFVDIELFEADKIGGRLATVTLQNNQYEAGGSIIHDRNQLMKRFSKLLGLEPRPNSGSELYGIWNGDEFIFQESNYEIITLVKLIYRYGTDPVYLHRYLDSILDDFDKIYKLHDDGHGFLNVTDFLAAMNPRFPEMLQVSIRDHLTNLGYSNRLIDELVQSTLVVNYGQETDVHSFVGCVSVTGAGSSLWSIKGGNKRVVEGLLNKHKHIRIRPHIVEKIKYNEQYDWADKISSDYPYTVTHKGENDGQADEYDIVIVTAPLTSDHRMLIEFQNFPNNENFIFSGNYQTTYATFIEGELNHTYFGGDSSIQGILSCNPEKTIVSSVGKLSSVEGEESSVWKIFTRNPLTPDIIGRMFSKIDEKTGPITYEWKAYPRYSVNDKPGSFKLHNALYHGNPIEWAASAMEMSAIGGRNVAILAYNDYVNRCKKLKDFRSKTRKLNSKIEL
ncbi:prenylcysteine oxidase [Fopius arisanus]|uniref:Prenylcysteine oxidase n=2 Tax=Fopius arisanus TaxID=64838 RepID=A0A9R1TYD3_9HYME|nr:PREDICTED: prenylcysteine oxidase-like [Fopius arisanus]